MESLAAVRYGSFSLPRVERHCSRVLRCLAGLAALTDCHPDGVIYPGGARYATDTIIRL